ncbi:unnamed protein product [Bursaphelenchus xylophilus]|uniref:(pine wood nematode) hypothetical protein n=1 Tax=Bursaphelenchus xylophilus TaxID=6326 RepID=A0A1I7RNG0_BURXY|nr:unnamed protein product [Bursaphelenchus xylophilus]CAG9123975.1 unnamed protein product [Bursaphelenchus xylophilus]
MEENEELDYETLENTIDLGEIDETEEAEIDRREKDLAKKREEENEYPLEGNKVDPSKFDLKEDRDEREEVTEADIQDLYDSLEVDLLDENVRATALFVRSLTPFSVYELERIFVEYDPIRCALLDANSGVVRFKSAFQAAEALIRATKQLLRVRQVDQQEDGEVDDEEDEDEEGNVVRKENGETVLVIKNSDHQTPSNLIELDVTKVQIPPGNWRFVIEHVPKNRFVFARLATGFELRTAMINPYKKEISDDRGQTSRDEEYESKDEYKRKRVRPGLNVFDEKGRELDWDYEHDTRFYDDDNKQEPSPKKAKGPEEIEIKGEKVRSRGRGTKKFVAALLEDSD